MASTAVLETEETVGPAVLTVRSLEVEAKDPPEESTILAAVSDTYANVMVVSAAKLLVTVKIADNPLSAKVTSVTALAVPSTLTVKSELFGDPETASEKPTTRSLPPRPAFCEVIVGRTSSMSIELDPDDAADGAGSVSSASLPDPSRIVPSPANAKLSVPT